MTRMARLPLALSTVGALFVCVACSTSLPISTARQRDLEAYRRAEEAERQEVQKRRQYWADQNAKAQADRDAEQARREVEARQYAQEAEATEGQRRLTEQQRAAFVADCQSKGGEFGDAWTREQTKTWTAETGTVCPEPDATFVVAQRAEADARKKASDAAERRQAFAESADSLALQRGWNHEGFWTAGDGDVVLVLKYWKCDRQFLYQFVNGLRPKLRELGFKQVDCENGASRWFEHVEQ
jgi:hypothetical protein